MAQPMTSGLRSALGFWCCLLLLLASWEAGATTISQQPQRTGEPLTAGLKALLPPGSHSAPPNHTIRHLEQQPPDHPPAPETQKPKRLCKMYQTGSTTGASKATDHGSSRVQHEVPRAAGQNASSQGTGLVIRNGRSTNNTQEGVRNRTQPNTAPRRRTSCKSTTRRSTRDTITTVRPEPRSTPTSRSTSHETTAPSHSSESHSKTTTLSPKATHAGMTPHVTERTPGASDHRTPSASDKPLLSTTEHNEEKIPATGGVTGPQATSTEDGIETLPANHGTSDPQSSATEYELQTTSANGRPSSPQVTPTEHKGDTAPANQRTLSSGATAHAGETTPRVSSASTASPEETTGNTEKVSRTPESPTVVQRRTTLVAKSTRPTTVVLETTRPPAKGTSPHANKTDTTRPGPTGSQTSLRDPSAPMSEAPGSTSHAQRSTDRSAGGVLAGAARQSDSFPAWAIVIVVLVAAILLLVFLGLVFLVFYAIRARHALTQNMEDNDPKDSGGRNSYPVYLMEQQNLVMGQIPSPPR